MANYYWLAAVNASGVEAASVAVSVVPMALVFSASSFPEDTTVGSVVAALSVVGLPGGVTVASYAITADPDSKFQIDGSNLELSAGVNYEADTSHSVTVQATLSNAATVDGTQAFTVTNVFEAASLNALTLDTSTVVEGTAAGVLVGTLQSVTGGSTLSLTDDAGGRFALDAGTIETGATATDYDLATSHNITVRETLADSANSPRDSVIAITVTEVVSWSPLDVTPTAWYDPSDLSTLWQDTAGTTAVTADGDPVGLMQDKSGNGIHWSQATTSKKPVYKTAAGLHWLQFDGTDDDMAQALAQGLASSTVHAAILTSDTNWVLFWHTETATAWFGLANSGVNSVPQGSTAGTPTYHVNNGAALTSTRAALYTAWSTGGGLVAEARTADMSTWETQHFGGYAARLFTGNLYGLTIVPEANLTTDRAALYTYLGAQAGISI